MGHGKRHNKFRIRFRVNLVNLDLLYLYMKTGLLLETQWLIMMRVKVTTSVQLWYINILLVYGANIKRFTRQDILLLALLVSLFLYTQDGMLIDLICVLETHLIGKLKYLIMMARLLF